MCGDGDAGYVAEDGPPPDFVMAILDGDYTLDGDYPLDSGGSTFTPPTDLIVGPINPDTTGQEARLMGYFPPHARGRNIWKLPDGTYTDVQPWPLITPQDAADGVLPIGDTATQVTYLFVYYGGHTYTVDPAEAAALTAAGFVVS